MGRYAWIAVIAVFAVAGVGAYVHVRKHPAAVPSTIEPRAAMPPSLSDAVIEALVQQLAQAKPAVTVGQWRTLHPGDRAEDSTWFQMTCATFQTTEQVADGITMTHIAGFYPPDPPKPIELPMNEDPAALVNNCVLAGVRVELTMSDRDLLLRSLPRIQAAFSSRLGTVTGKPSGPQLWFATLQPVWHAGNLTVVIEDTPDIDAGRPTDRSAKDLWQTHPTLVAYAYMPQWLYESLGRPDHEYARATPETSPEIFRMAMSAAAVEQADLARTMTDLYQDCVDRPLDRDDDAFVKANGMTPGLARGKKVVEPLRQWLSATHDLTPQRKAAALLAAYFLLRASTSRLGFSDIEEMRDGLLDAQVLSDEHEFTQSGLTVKWLKEAQTLDPDGPVGDAITLMTITAPQPVADLLSQEYRPTKTLPDGRQVSYPVAESEGQKDVTDYVIETGQKYLAKARDPDTTERVEFFIASAYSDRIQLAHLLNERGEGNEATKWEIQRAETAKAEALKFYRLALAHNSPLSDTAWRSGWSLQAGLPLMFQFYEIGD